MNFGDPLHNTIIGGFARATKEAESAYLMIAVGSSLRVSPASFLILLPPHVAIVNLQSTDYDSKAAVRSFSESDLFFEYLLDALDGDPSESLSVPLLSKITDRDRDEAWEVLEMNVDHASNAWADPPQKQTKANAKSSGPAKKETKEKRKRQPKSDSVTSETTVTVASDIVSSQRRKRVKAN